MKKIIAVLLLIITGMGVLLLYQMNQKEQAVNTSQTGSGASENFNAPAPPSSGEVLDLAQQGLREVPKNKLDNRAITKMDVSGNQLTGALPAEIRLLKNVEELDASDNTLTGIPAEIGQLSKLRVADFSNNDISGLPLEIGNLSNLRTLDLRGNPNVSKYDLSLIKPKIPNAQILTD